MKQFLSALFSDFVTVLPIILQAVRAVHAAAPDLPGAAKKAVVTATVAAAATQAGTPLTAQHVTTVANLNDAVVEALKAAGELQKPVAPTTA